MKKLSALCFFCIIFFGLTFTAYANDAWYTTKWGMSPDEVSAAIGTSLKPLSGKNIANEDVQYMLPKFAIGKDNFEVYFGFKDKKLSFILLNSIDDKYGAFLRLKDGLMQKYGATADSKNNGTRTSSLESYDWISESSLISLNHVMLAISGNAHVTTNVQYRPRVNSESDKL
jgi:hypothetical protein